MLNFNVQHFMSIELELSTYINNNNPLSRFPKNPEICLKWKQFCGLREDDIHALYICSFHFCQKDFRCNILPTKRQLLNPGAVPSIRFRKRHSLIRKNAKSTLTKINEDETVIEKLQSEMLRDNEMWNYK